MPATHECAVWEGRGPVRSHARTEYHLTENGDGGTDFHYVNEFKAPGGPLGQGRQQGARRRPARSVRPRSRLHS